MRHSLFALTCLTLLSGAAMAGVITVESAGGTSETQIRELIPRSDPQIRELIPRPSPQIRELIPGS